MNPPLCSEDPDIEQRRISAAPGECSPIFEECTTSVSLIEAWLFHAQIATRFESARFGDDRRMSDEHENDMEDEELEAQDGEELPDREVMSVITPEPVDGDIVFPVEGDPGDEW
jgi:hypothetical protein